MSWMIHEHAAQIVRGLTNDKNPSRWKIWLLSGFVVFLVGIAGGWIFLKMRPPLAPIARDTPALAAEPTTTFTPLLPAEMPQGGWTNPEAEMTRRNLNPHPRAAKPVAAPHKRVSVPH
jgi:hypothetical protein